MSIDLLAGLTPQQDDYATQVVERLLCLATQMKASDIHISEKANGGERTLLARFRVHGKLLDLPPVPDGQQARILSRLKALARLLTYRHDIPQEGRLEFQGTTVRIGTLPTLHGERAVIRLQVREKEKMNLDALGLGEDTIRLRKALAADCGVIMITGPAGAGKTTTAYACLLGILGQSTARSIVSLEDPVESEIAGADQSQINADVDYDWELGLKSILRQDPEVLFIGEIRDAMTASIVFKAATTGQLVITTLHARSVADAVARLLEMKIPAHQIRSNLLFLNCQRLRANACECGGTADCPRCGGAGLAGRQLATETLPPIGGDVAQSICLPADTARIHEAALGGGMRSLKSSSSNAPAASPK